ALLFSFNPTAIAFAQTLDAEVVSVGDGDTLRASVAGETVTVRLSCIDAPETAQTPWGNQSRDRLKQLLQRGDRVELRVETTDRYGRTVAEIFERGASVNLQLVEEGQAVVYRKYLSGCSQTSDRYLEAEAQARDRYLGFWNQNDPVMPWDFRKGDRATNAPEQPQGGSQSFQQTGN
ncbi:MAG: thermonuclease family protein, partial [Cyanobacteria bacterium J06642_2]